MARNPTSDDASAPAASSAANHLSAGDAAALMSATANSLRQQWLQSAVTIANVLKRGQTVPRGTFKDLRRARGNYEELERARRYLENMDETAQQGAASVSHTDDA